MTDSVIKPFKRQVFAHPKLPRVDVLTPSYALQIRDKIMDRIKLIKYFSGFKKYSTNKALQIQSQDIPFFGVYFIEEVGTPDGAINLSEVRFKTICRYGFSVIVQNNDATDAERHLDYSYQAITGGLLTDETLLNWDGKHGGAKIEGFARGSRTHVFGSIGQSNEYPIAELRFDLSCDIGVITFEPVIPDVFETMHVTTVRHDDDPNRQTIISEYDIDQNT